MHIANPLIFSIFKVSFTVAFICAVGVLSFFEGSGLVFWAFVVASGYSGWCTVVSYIQCRVRLRTNKENSFAPARLKSPWIFIYATVIIIFVLFAALGSRPVPGHPYGAPHLIWGLMLAIPLSLMWLFVTLLSHGIWKIYCSHHTDGRED